MFLGLLYLHLAESMLDHEFIGPIMQHMKASGGSLKGAKLTPMTFSFERIPLKAKNSQC